MGSEMPLMLTSLGSERPNLATLAQVRDSGGLVDTLAGEVATDLGGARGVHSDPDRRAESLRLALLRQAALNRDGAGDGLLGRVESDEEPVARGRDLLALVGVEERSKRLVVPPQDGLPGLVP
jgi:hypothetical protein